jgi:hypothetical protein
LKTFSIEKEKVLGLLMDFSVFQRLDFQLAYQSVFNMTYAQTLAYVKGCYMHRMKSVEHIKKNYQVVPAHQADEFLSLAYKIRRVTSVPVFKETGKAILSKFPNSCSWLEWWLQPSICSMIFNCKKICVSIHIGLVTLWTHTIASCTVLSQKDSLWESVIAKWVKEMVRCFQTTLILVYVLHTEPRSGQKGAKSL